MKSKLLAVHVIELICISRRKTLKPLSLEALLPWQKWLQIPLNYFLLMEWGNCLEFRCVPLYRLLRLSTHLFLYLLGNATLFYQAVIVVSMWRAADQNFSILSAWPINFTISQWITLSSTLHYCFPGTRLKIFFSM